MKKILAALLTAAAALSVAGCSRGADNSFVHGTSTSQNSGGSVQTTGSASVRSTSSSLPVSSSSTHTTEVSSASHTTTSKPESGSAASSSASQEPPEVSSSQEENPQSSEQSVHQHDYKIYHEVEPSCETEGYVIYKCSCGEQHTDYTQPLGHNFTQTVVNATCTAIGYTQYTCLRCGYQYTDNEISAKGHSWGDWTTAIEPTTSSEGEQVSVCSECGEQRRQSIPKLEGISNYISAVVSIVNAERAKAGLPPLSENDELGEYAQLRSSELVNDFAHKRPDGSSPLDYVMEMSGIHTAGENIAMGYDSPESVMEGWMNSSGHRANILKQEFTMIGVGCYEYNGRLYWTQIFAG